MGDVYRSPPQSEDEEPTLPSARTVDVDVVDETHDRLPLVPLWRALVGLLLGWDEPSSSPDDHHHR